MDDSTSRFNFHLASGGGATDYYSQVIVKPLSIGVARLLSVSFWVEELYEIPAMLTPLMVAE